MTEPWTTAFTSSAEKAARKLPKKAAMRMVSLLSDLREKGPVLASWPHYSQLLGLKGQRKGERRFHCHIQTGRQSIVVCWKVWGAGRQVEVYYVGSHGGAPY